MKFLKIVLRVSVETRLERELAILSNDISEIWVQSLAYKKFNF